MSRIISLRAILSKCICDEDAGNKSLILLLVVLTIGVVLSVWAAVCIGVVPIAPEDVWRILVYKLFHLDIGDAARQVPLSYRDIVWDLRFPRVLMAVIAGAGLALCGAVMQASVQNPLAEPYILGVSAGASMGAAFSILIGSPLNMLGFGTTFWAFAGALAAALLVMVLANTGGQMSTAKIVLSGTVANALFMGLTNLMVYMSGNADGLRTVTFWTMGSLAASKWDNLALPAVGIVLCSVYFLAQPSTLNVLLLGEEAAVTLGVDLNKVRRNNMIIAALMTALVVSACGVFAFIGLIIPHIVRGLIGSNHRRLIPCVILAGALFLTWADVFARVILKSGEMPIGIITSLIGAPFFMYILLKHTFRFGNR
jgi:iron complex transport system permease protein